MTVGKPSDEGGSGYLTVREVSDYLSIPAETIYKYVRQGRMPGFKVGKHWRFARRQIDEWVRGRWLSHNAPRVLVVDDDVAICDLMEHWLVEEGCDVTCVHDGRDAVSMVNKRAFQLVFLDLMLPGMNGYEVLKEIRESSPRALIAVVTAYFHHELMDKVLKLCPVVTIRKPLQRDAVTAFLASVSNCGGRALGQKRDDVTTLTGTSGG